jgi:hypothetical protein
MRQILAGGRPEMVFKVGCGGSGEQHQLHFCPGKNMYVFVLSFSVSQKAPRATEADQQTQNCSMTDLFGYLVGP